ncbi:MAG: S8 family serine peptidase, partial [Pseudomonadota bacterium]
MILTSRALSICLFCLIVSLFSSAALSADEKLLIDPQLFDHKQADRIILVTYADSHINRISVGSISQQYYRRRGEYDSSTWSKRVASDIEREYQLKILSQWPIKEIGEHCVVYLISENHSMNEIISSLSKDNRIGNVQSMGTFTIMANNFTDTYYRLQSNIHGINLDKIHDQTTGKNISIAIVDTGVDAKHPDLEGQIQVRKDFVTQKSTDLAADIHGTAVAGVIAAKANNGEGIVGIAPDSRITSLKACWQLKPGNMDAICNTFTLALA